MSKLRILELFGGIGACSKALERLDIDYEIADYVEIDKYAVKSFNAIHNTNFEPQDITTWDKDIEVDLIMHGSPCQDFSLAGKQAGGDESSGTRSSLMYETIRIVDKLKPKYVIWENVKNLLSKKHIHNFNAYLERMDQLGYINYYQVLNAKDYGIPQNRERVFTVSILGDRNFEFPEGDINDNKIIEHNPKGKHQQDLIQDEEGLCKCIPAGTHGSTPHLLKTVVRSYEFSPKQELRLKLKDMLEDEVDEKYYLSEKMMNYVLDNNETQKGTKWEGRADNDTLNSNIAHTLSVRGAGGCQRAGVSNFILDNHEEEIKVKDVKRKYGVFDTEKSKHQAGSVYDENGLSPTLDTMQGGWRQPCIEIKEATKQGYKEAFEGDGVNISSRMKYQRGNVQKESIQTPTTSGGNDRGVVLKNLRIRKLTPKECWRLMGFDDEDYERAARVNSNTQLYKQAGNSIVVNVLEAILKNLLLETNQDVITGQMSIYDYINVSNSK